MTGIDAFLNVLAASGILQIFGNPGTTELPLNAALARDPRFHYRFGIHEIPVMAMADGYAQASGQVAVVNVHISCGLGNAMGMLYNAFVEGAPLLLTAGQQDRRLLFSEPVLAGDLVRVAQPWTKWSYEIGRPEDIPAATRRALQIALTPPTGPVFLSIPVDVQQATVQQGLDLRAACIPASEVRPAQAALEQAAELLAQARRPAILAGSRVTENGACTELGRVAQRLGAPVFVEADTGHGRMPVSTRHRLFAGPLPYWAPELRQVLQEFDVLLVVGMELFRLYIYQEPAEPLPENIRLVQMDCNPNAIGRNYPIEVGLLSHLRVGLSELDEQLAKHMTTAAVELAQQRGTAFAEHYTQERQAFQESLDQAMPERPIQPQGLMGVLARVLPEDTAVVEEAITTHHNALERLGVLSDPAGHFAQRGWALGWGMGFTLGVKLAWPQRPVLGLIGDGAALYGIQALWSAVHHRIPAVFVLCNNARYRILEVCGKVLNLPELSTAACPGLRLDAPLVDFTALARSFGMRSQKITDLSELAELLPTALRGDQPCLFEVELAN